MRRDNKEDFDVLLSVDAQAHTTTVDGAAADLNSGPYNSCTGVVAISDYTDGTMTYQMQEKDDGGSWSAVADADIDGTEPTIETSSDADNTFKVGYRGNKDQVRWTIETASGVSSGHEGTAYFIVGDKRNK